MLALPTNQLLPPASSFPSQNYPNPKTHFVLNPESVFFCTRPPKWAFRAHPNLLRNLNSSSSNGNSSYNLLQFPPRNCGGSIRVQCGGSSGEDDVYYMRRAVERAKEAIGCTSPNPMVGCVIVKDGHIVGEGFHPKAGQPHAENRGGSVRAGCGGSSGEDDAYYMRRVVERAKEAIGCKSPNPMVGCVIVKDGQIVGEGFYPKAGQSHAEVFALRNAGELAMGATVYVSLEPCNHYGRTPPCTEGLIKAKVSKVVVGMVDPNPIVASKGVERLLTAGIEVVVGLEEDLCKRLIECYVHKMLTGKPFVTVGAKLF